MHVTIGRVFLVIACMLLAVALFELFFGNPKGVGGRPRGALWFAADKIQAPISEFYYTYMYAPTVKMVDGVDGELGVGRQTTPPSDVSSGEMYTYHSEYTEGWT